MNPTRGFTLIEAAAVMAVLAILVALALPSFAQQLARQRLRAVAETLATDMAQARHLAAQRGGPVSILFEQQGTQWCYAVSQTPGCGCSLPLPCQLKAERGADHAGVALVRASSLALDDQAPAAAAEVAEFATEAGARLRVRLSALGRPQVCAVTPLPGMLGC